MDPWGTYPPVEPWGTLAPMMMPRGGEPPEGWPAWRARKEAEARAAGMTGAPTPPHPLSGAGLVNTAVGFTPVGAAMDFAEAAGQGRRAATWGEMLPAVGAGMMAAAGALPGVGPAAKGVKAAAKLPMDEATRLARADAMGFRRDMPLLIGKAPEGEGISGAALVADGREFTAPSHYQAMEEAERLLRRPYDDMTKGPIPEGYMTTSGRYVSRREGADISARAGQGETTKPFGRQYGLASEDVLPPISSHSEVATAATAPGLMGGQGVWGQVLPPGHSPAAASTARIPGAKGTSAPATAVAWPRTENLKRIDASRFGEQDLQMAIREAWGKGHDGVILENYTRPGGKTPESVFVAKDLSQLREPGARFDPAKRLSPDLLAGIGIPALTFGMMLPQLEERY